jgi:uncharacterized Zn finger protein
VIARLYQEGDASAEALAWVDRGLQLDTGRYSGAEFDLCWRKRTLLQAVGRVEAALAFASQEFHFSPSPYTYHTWLECAPESERAEWHSKAMRAIDGGALYTVIPLWPETHEIERLVARLRQAEDKELETLSHVTTEPAATRLTTSHPDVAAKLYRALGWRVLAAQKSKYYEVAVAHFAQAKLCYEQSGLDSEWQALVAAVRRTHGRKYSFMPAFQRIVADQAPPPQVSFLEHAQQRWQHHRRL